MAEPLGGNGRNRLRWEILNQNVGADVGERAKPSGIMGESVWNSGGIIYGEWFFGYLTRGASNLFVIPKKQFR